MLIKYEIKIINILGIGDGDWGLANCVKNVPEVPGMKVTGMNTAINTKVHDTTVNLFSQEIKYALIKNFQI